ncbi:MAG: TldD/PmbA family protein [Candidatus Pacebacteria bacterium]|nr:TldD/PmbA family protein [Candidatus Paceibacterota bacterium]
MIGKRNLKKITDYVLTKSSADQTEVLLSASNFGLTRFAQNRIHQNLVRETSGLSIRVVLGKRIGVASTNNLVKKALEQTLAKAIKIAQNQRPDPDFGSLPEKTKYTQVKAFCQATADFSPRQRAKRVAEVIKQAKSRKMAAFGALSNGVTELAVANSLGVWAWFPSTQADFSVTIRRDEASGHGSDLGLAVERLGIEAETKKAIRAAQKGKEPRRISPGEYEVVLAPAAVNQMLIYLAYLGFGARAYHEDRSFLSAKLGEKVLDEKITLIDDPLDPQGLPIPFDLEGAAKKRLVLVEKGIARRIVYDSYLAGKYGQKNTGHGLPAPNTLDALATHLHLEPARKKSSFSGQEGGGLKNSWPSSDERILISGVKKGLYVSRFWYVNAHHHKTLTITGLTRDGTFKIKDGRIASPVFNLRFTQSIPEALSQVLGIGTRAKVLESWLGANRVPALRLGKFNFTGVSRL